MIESFDLNRSVKYKDVITSFQGHVFSRIVTNFGCVTTCRKEWEKRIAQLINLKESAFLELQGIIKNGRTVSKKEGRELDERMRYS